jgi:hypothetical protein
MMMMVIIIIIIIYSILSSNTCYGYHVFPSIVS